MTSLPESPCATTEASRTNPAKELRQRIDGHIEALAKAVDDVRASDDFRRYLDVQARFHSYSWHNAMLIFSQCPDATLWPRAL